MDHFDEIVFNRLLFSQNASSSMLGKFLNMPLKFLLKVTKRNKILMSESVQTSEVYLGF